MERLGRHGERLKELRRRLRQRRPGEVIVDGRRLVGDLVRWQVPIRELYVATGVMVDPAVITVAERSWELEPSLFEAVAPTRSPQGVLAVVDEPAWPPWSGRSGLGVWLDGVQDPGNLGAIVRSSAGLGVRVVLLSPGCADPFGAAAVRGSSGAVLRVPVEREVTVARAVERVRSHGGEVWASAGDGTPVEDWRPSAPTLLLLGAEGWGLSPTALAAADGVVTIPLERGVESLNVAVAAGILLHRYRCPA